MWCSCMCVLMYSVDPDGFDGGYVLLCNVNVLLVLVVGIKCSWLM